MADERCPTCGHAHPGGIGAGYCGCDDCQLLWTPVPYRLLSEESRAKLDALQSARSVEDGTNG